MWNPQDRSVFDSRALGSLLSVPQDDIFCLVIVFDNGDTALPYLVQPSKHIPNMLKTKTLNPTP